MLEANNETTSQCLVVSRLDILHFVSLWFVVLSVGGCWSVGIWYFESCISCSFLVACWFLVYCCFCWSFGWSFHVPQDSQGKNTVRPIAELESPLPSCGLWPKRCSPCDGSNG